MGNHIVGDNLSSLPSPVYKVISGGRIKSDGKKSQRIFLCITLGAIIISCIFLYQNFTIYQTVFTNAAMTTPSTGYSLMSKAQVMAFLKMMGLAIFIMTLVCISLKVLIPSKEVAGISLLLILLTMAIGISGVVLSPWKVSPSEMTFSQWAEQRYGVVNDEPDQSYSEGTVFTYNNMEKIAVVKEIDNKFFLYNKKSNGIELPLKGVK